MDRQIDSRNDGAAPNLGCEVGAEPSPVVTRLV